MRSRSWRCSGFVLGSVSALLFVATARGDFLQPSLVEMAVEEIAQLPPPPAHLRPLQSTAPQSVAPAPTAPAAPSAPRAVEAPAPSTLQPLPPSALNGPPLPPADTDASLYAYPNGLPSGCEYGGVCSSVAGDLSYRDSSACDLASCDDCSWCPLWTARAGMIFLRRDNQDNVVLSNGATPITVDGLGFHDYQAGPLVTVMRHNVWGTLSTLEVTYFGVSDSNIATSAGATSFFTTPSVNFGARTVTSNYLARLNSTEINLRRNWNDWLTLLGGFRWVELRDELATDLVGATHNVNVNNHLYGFQIGADAVLLRRGALSIESFGKAGIYGNTADQTTTSVGIAGTVPTFSAGSSRSAFLGELALTAMYDITSNWSIRGGYQAIWLDGIALAPNQLANSNIATGVAALDSGSQALYHGFTAAIQCAW